MRRRLYKDDIESVLDKISVVREELVAIERSLERICVAKPKRTRKTAATLIVTRFKDAGRKM